MEAPSSYPLGEVISVNLCSHTLGAQPFGSSSAAELDRWPVGSGGAALGPRAYEPSELDPAWSRSDVAHTSACMLRGRPTSGELRTLSDSSDVLEFVRHHEGAMLTAGSWRHLVVIDAVGVHIIDFLPRSCWQRAKG